MTGRAALAVALLAAALPALALPALAETTALQPLDRRDQMLGWEAVGRIDIRDGGFCTGALVATNLVLTAAHCVFDDAGRPVDPARLTFRAGYGGGETVAEGRVQRTVAHPGYDPVTPVSPQNVRHDVALLELAQPIPAAVAAPYSVVSPGKGTAVSVLSYAQGREEVLSWQRECEVLDRAEGLVALNCDVSFGSSGAPVFDRTGPRARIVSMISAGGPTDKGPIAYGMDLPGALRDLKGLLAAGRPLAVASAEAAEDAGAAPPAAVRRLGTGTGESRDIGARFVKAKPAP